MLNSKNLRFFLFNKKKGEDKKLVIGIILAIVVIAVASFAVVMVNSNNNDNQNIANENSENVNNEVENINNEDNNIPNEENTTNTDNNTQVSSNKKTLVAYDFTGKNVYLFSTNGGSGLSGTVSTITNKLSGANVNSSAFKLHRNSMEDAPEEVETWLKQINIID